MLPVAEAIPGIRPSRLLNRTKKKTVQRYGRKASAPWPPIAGRATWSRMNRTIASNMFMNRPAGHVLPRDVPGQRDDDQRHQHRGDHLRDHEPGDLEPGDRRQVDLPARTGARQ